MRHFHGEDKKIHENPVSFPLNLIPEAIDHKRHGIHTASTFGVLLLVSEAFILPHSEAWKN